MGSIPENERPSMEPHEAPCSTVSEPSSSHPLLGHKFKVLRSTNQIKELQTIIRDSTTSRSDFKFVADRLIRMVIEEGLNQLPYTDCEVTTPTGCTYAGLR
jgi:uracil phosphoribosyltransferase